MELRQLECFVRTAELGSFTKAANLLHISQPALSKNIALLESNLGTKLFARNGKRISLNSTGVLVLEQAQEILDRYDRIYGICQNAKQANRNQITLRMMAASEYLPKILSGFKSVSPEIQIISTQSTGSMDQDDVDVLVYASVREHRYTADHSVLCEPILLAVPEGHPLFGRDSVSFSDIAEYGIMSLRPGNDMRTIEDHYFELAGVTPNREIECDIPSTLRSLIRSGFGLSMVPAVTWSVTEQGNVKCIPIRGLSCVRYINVNIPHPKKSTANIEALCRYLETFFAGISAGDVVAQP